MRKLLFIAFNVILLSILFTFVALRIDNEISGNIWRESFSDLERILGYTALILGFTSVPIYIIYFLGTQPERPVLNK